MYESIEGCKCQERIDKVLVAVEDEKRELDPFLFCILTRAYDTAHGITYWACFAHAGWLQLETTASLPP
jgi:hypothetical protein